MPQGSFQIDPARKIAFVNAVLDGLRGSPGVRAAAASFTSPLTGAPNRGISLDRQAPKAPGQEDTADFQLVTPDYFRTLGVPVVQGRTFTDLDTANSPHVAVVNQAFVDAYLRGENPIGRLVRFGARGSHEIVGVVADMRYRRLESPADPTFYLPITQNAERWPFLSFTVWQDGDPGAAMTSMRRAIQQADPAQAVTRVRTFDDILRTSLAARRFNTILVAAFAAVALLLAAIGAYGVMAYAVSVRTRELGVRAALGASPYELRRMLLAQGARLTGGAVAIGAIAALAASGLLRAMLYGVTPRDPAIFAGVAIVLALVALAATALPSRRATRINPIQALRRIVTPPAAPPPGQFSSHATPGRRLRSRRSWQGRASPARRSPDPAARPRRAWSRRAGPVPLPVTSPITAPTAMTRTVLPMTRRNTSLVVAPSARRTPMSRTRCWIE